MCTVLAYVQKCVSTCVCVCDERGGSLLRAVADVSVLNDHSACSA